MRHLVGFLITHAHSEIGVIDGGKLFLGCLCTHRMHMESTERAGYLFEIIFCTVLFSTTGFVIAAGIISQSYHSKLKSGTTTLPHERQFDVANDTKGNSMWQTQVSITRARHASKVNLCSSPGRGGICCDHVFVGQAGRLRQNFQKKL